MTIIQAVIFGVVTAVVPVKIDEHVRKWVKRKKTAKKRYFRPTPNKPFDVSFVAFVCWYCCSEKVYSYEIKY